MKKTLIIIGIILLCLTSQVFSITFKDDLTFQSSDTTVRVIFDEIIEMGSLAIENSSIILTDMIIPSCPSTTYTKTIITNGDTLSSTFGDIYCISGSGSGGGGGGGGTTQPPIPSGKIDCELFISPKKIKLTKDESIIDLTITNKELFSITPLISFNYTEGDETTFNEVKLTNNLQTISGNSQYLTGVRIIDTNKESEAKGNIIITTIQCKDIIIPLEIELKNKSAIKLATDEVIDTIQNQNVTQTISDLGNMSFFESKETDNTFIKIINNIFTVLGLTIIVGIFMTILIFSIDSENYWMGGAIGDKISRISLSIIVTSIIGFILWLIYIIIN